MTHRIMTFGIMTLRITISDNYTQDNDIWYNYTHDNDIWHNDT